MPAERVDGASILTLEGLASEERELIARCFVAAHDGVRRYTLPMKDSPAARAMKVGRIRSLNQ